MLDAVLPSKKASWLLANLHSDMREWLRTKDFETLRNRTINYESWNDGKMQHAEKTWTDHGIQDSSWFDTWKRTGIIIETLSQMNQFDKMYIRDFPTRRYLVCKTVIVVQTICEMDRTHRPWRRADGGNY